MLVITFYYLILGLSFILLLDITIIIKFYIFLGAINHLIIGCCFLLLKWRQPHNLKSISKKRCPHWIVKNAWIVPHWRKTDEPIELAGCSKGCFVLLSSKNWPDKNGNAIGCRVFFNYIGIPSASAPCMKGKLINNTKLYLLIVVNIGNYFSTNMVFRCLHACAHIHAGRNRQYLLLCWTVL